MAKIVTRKMGMLQKNSKVSSNHYFEVEMVFCAIITSFFIQIIFPHRFVKYSQEGKPS
jgi:hypothetical protein